MTVLKTGYYFSDDKLIVFSGDFIPVSDEVFNAATCRYRCDAAQIVSIYSIDADGKPDQYFTKIKICDKEYKVAESYQLTNIYLDQQIAIDNWKYCNVSNYSGSITRYYDNGNIMQVCNFKNSNKDGLYQRFNEDGKLMEDKYYKDGVEVKSITGYKVVDDCVLLTLKVLPENYKSQIASENIKNPKTARYDLINEGAKITAIFDIKNNKDIDQAKYNHKTYRVNDTITGYYFHFDQQVAINCWRCWNISNFTGSITLYHDNGAKSIIRNYKDGKFDGLSQFFNSDGKLTEKAHYKDGNLVKNFKYEDGKLVKKTYYIIDDNDPELDDSADSTTDSDNFGKSIDPDQLLAKAQKENEELRAQVEKIEEVEKLQKENAELLVQVKKLEDIQNLQVQNSKLQDRIRDLTKNITSE